jgi:hypothetical protein
MGFQLHQHASKTAWREENRHTPDRTLFVNTAGAPFRIFLLF